MWLKRGVLAAKRSIGVSVLVALLVAMLVGCAAGTAGDAARPAEDETVEIQTDEQPDSLEGITANSRVVALSRSVGELWLLAGGQLAGVTDDAFDLTGISADTVSVGTISKPSLEQILALEPDLVMLTQDLSAHKEAGESLRQMGIPVMVVDVNCFADYDEVMSALVAATGRSDLYEQNVATVAEQINAVLASSAREGRGTYLALRTSSTKNKVLKHDYFACAMLDDLGLVNVADDTSALDDLSLEAIVDADPDWVFVVYQGKDAEAQEAFEQAFESNPVWSQLTAVREGRVVVLPKDLFQYKPNARWGEAYAHLVDVLDGPSA